ncbi:hypothetical protein NSED_08230 [Candidatus Nitrosopumilus sediminis]|uniref:Uncharacterized protein n=1 Tax=Candidatus Nitrosopumilus sediminis TaxID=1229909 RepID=K0BB82_9ARCH|nr:hypothetical protein NSED_08230 [Candidatus Nitrosopumilus sediminis]
MMKVILCTFLILLLVPFSQAFSAEVTDTPSTLTVSLKNESQFVYQDAEGYTVVVGLAENKNPLTPVTNVKIQVNFYDDYDSAPLEVVQGYTTLEVIAPNGKSTYSIRSQTPNPNITQASVSLLGFDSSEAKQKGLTVYSTSVFSDYSFRFSGILENGGAPNSDTNVYLAFYDGFEPPRFLGVYTIELGDVDPNAEISFEFNEVIDSRAVGFFLFAESNIFSSDLVDIKIPPSQIPDKLVTISNVFLEDSNGNKLSELSVGSPVNIKSETWIQFAADQQSDETAYTYYVQVKESGKLPYVEYVGKFDGRFIGTGLETQTIDWIPEKTGLFFIETFVWDRNNVPIADQGPFVLVVVS